MSEITERIRLLNALLESVELLVADAVNTNANLRRRRSLRLVPPPNTDR